MVFFVGGMGGVDIQPPFCPLGPWVRAGMLGWLIILALVCVRTSAQRLLRENERRNAQRSGALGGSWTLGFRADRGGWGRRGSNIQFCARRGARALSNTPRTTQSQLQSSLGFSVPSTEVAGVLRRSLGAQSLRPLPTAAWHSPPCPLFKALRLRW